MNESRVTQLLRALGALFLLISASTFLLSAWPEQNDLVRYLVLSGHVGGLFLAALYCGKKLKEPKTARVLLWTSTATVPFLLAALGGLIYSQFSLDPQSASLPEIATWVAPSGWSALIVATFSLPLVYGVTRGTARVFSSSLGRTWSRVFVAQCLLFLVPVRGPNWAALLVMVGLSVPFLFDRFLLPATEQARTVEGRLLRALLWAGPTMIAIRTMSFYPVSDFFVASLQMVGGVAALLVAGQVDLRSSRLRGLLELACAGLVGAGSIRFASECLPTAWGGLLLLFPVLALLLLAKLMREARKWVEFSTAVGMTIGSGAVLVLSPDVVECLGFFVFFILLFAVSYSEKSNKMMVLAGLLAAASLLSLFERLVGFQDVQLWQVLSSLGVVAFVLAATLEKRLPGIVQRLRSSPV